VEGSGESWVGMRSPSLPPEELLGGVIHVVTQGQETLVLATEPQAFCRRNNDHSVLGYRLFNALILHWRIQRPKKKNKRNRSMRQCGPGNEH
jgi:hypothetical protein